MRGFVVAMWAVVVLSSSACGPGGGGLVSLTRFPAVPGTTPLYGAGFDGEQPLVVANPPGSEPTALWRYDGSNWSQLLTAAFVGNPSRTRTGSAVLVNQPAGGSDQFHFVRIVNGNITHTPVTQAGTVLGEQSDGSLLVGEGRTVWRLAPGAADFEVFSTDPQLADWNGAVLDDDRLLNLTKTGLVLFDKAGTRLSTIACGALLCAKDALGVGVVGGQPHIVFGSPLDEAYVITRVDLTAGSLVTVGRVPTALELEGVTFAAIVAQLAVTEGRWFAVRVEDYASSEGWLVYNSIDGQGSPAVVTKKFTLGGGLFTTPGAVWAYEPQKRTFSRMPR